MTLGHFIRSYCPEENPQVFNPVCVIFFSLRLTLYAVAAGSFYLPWEDLHLTAWAAPSFTTSPNMSLDIG
jgi:hypothetical protein